MAQGRNERMKRAVVVEQGNYGRVSPAPEGKIFIRDPHVARANAIRRRAEAHRLAGVEIPAHLKNLLDGLKTSDGESEIELVDEITGALSEEKVEVASAQPWSPPETPPAPGTPPNPVPVEHHPAPQVEPKPEPEPEPEPVAVAEPESDLKPQPEPEPKAAGEVKAEPQREPLKDKPASLPAGVRRPRRR